MTLEIHTKTSQGIKILRMVFVLLLVASMGCGDDYLSVLLQSSDGTNTYSMDGQDISLETLKKRLVRLQKLSTKMPILICAGERTSCRVLLDLMHDINDIGISNIVVFVPSEDLSAYQVKISDVDDEQRFEVGAAAKKLQEVTPSGIVRWVDTKSEKQSEILAKTFTPTNQVTCHQGESIEKPESVKETRVIGVKEISPQESRNRMTNDPSAGSSSVIP